MSVKREVAEKRGKKETERGKVRVSQTEQNVNAFPPCLSELA